MNRSKSASAHFQPAVPRGSGKIYHAPLTMVTHKKTGGRHINPFNLASDRRGNGGKPVEYECTWKELCSYQTLKTQNQRLH